MVVAASLPSPFGLPAQATRREDAWWQLGRATSF